MVIIYAQPGVTRYSTGTPTLTILQYSNTNTPVLRIPNDSLSGLRGLPDHVVHGHHCTACTQLKKQGWAAVTARGLLARGFF